MTQTTYFVIECIYVRTYIALEYDVHRLVVGNLNGRAIKSVLGASIWCILRHKLHL